MSETNQNQNNAQNTSGQEQNNTNQSQQNTNQSQQNIDVEAERADAVNKLLSDLGVSDTTTLESIIKKHKEDEEANKTELQKATDSVTEVTKQLIAEREKSRLAEAKLSAVQLGVKPEMVDDFVVLANTRVTEQKDITKVTAEMKADAKYSFYFADKQDEGVRNKNVTRKEPEGNQNKDGNQNKGTIAERLFANKKPVKNSFYGKKE